MAQELERWLCETYGGASLVEIDPYRGHPAAYEQMREVTLGAQLQATRYGTITLREARLRGSPMPRSRGNAPIEYNLEAACVFGVVVRHVKSTCEHPVQLRLNYAHSGLENAHAAAAHAAQETLGGAKRAFATIKRTCAQGEDVRHVALRPGHFHATNPGFVETMALLNEQNLRNGIVRVPERLAGPLAATLPQLLEGTPEPAEYRHWVALPGDHVLAWPLHVSNAERLRRGVRALELRVKDPQRGGRVAFFLVHAPAFDRMMREFSASWLGLVDVRPLMDVGIEFVRPPACEENSEGEVTVRAHISYMVAPTMTPEERAQLAPRLSPRMPPFRNWVEGNGAEEVQRVHYKTRKE